MRTSGFTILALTLSVLVSGCSKQEIPAPIKIIKKQRLVAQENPVPGTVDEAWVEKMHDTVKIPGQLDPTGTYYRLPHKTIYEIRPGRYQEVQYPGDSNEAKTR